MLRNIFQPKLIRRWIKKIKGVKFHDRYQPTLYGMSETYLSDEYNGID